jgi:CheY-like chemotaxis protein
LVLDDIDFSAGQKVRETTAAFSRQAEKKHLELVLDISPEIPAQLCGDAKRLGQVLSSVLDNALKFTEAGSVRVSVKVSRTEGPTTFLKIEVRDTGIGISAEHLALLFQPFSQADGSSTRRFGGTGLGLALAKLIVDAMGGTITVSSIEGQGSTFEIEAPFRTAPLQESIAPSTLSERTAPLQQSSILLVEDNPVNQKVAAQMLRRAGLQCDLAVDGKKAVAAVTQRHYDLILMDCQMPEMDGYEATREIRKLEVGGDTRTRIVALTANSSDGDRERCLDAGMDDHVGKPMSSKRLSEVLRVAGIAETAKHC